MMLQLMYLCGVLDSGAVYEVKLVAYNGNGESDCSKRLVSLAEDGTAAKASAGKTMLLTSSLTCKNIFYIGNKLHLYYLKIELQIVSCNVLEKYMIIIGFQRIRY